MSICGTKSTCMTAGGAVVLVLALCVTIILLVIVLYLCYKWIQSKDTAAENIEAGGNRDPTLLQKIQVYTNPIYVPLMQRSMTSKYYRPAGGPNGQIVERRRSSTPEIQRVELNDERAAIQTTSVHFETTETAQEGDHGLTQQDHVYEAMPSEDQTIQLHRSMSRSRSQSKSVDSHHSPEILSPPTESSNKDMDINYDKRDDEVTTATQLRNSSQNGKLLQSRLENPRARSIYDNAALLAVTSNSIHSNSDEIFVEVDSE